MILQSSYIPWRGYFDLIRQADQFVFLDDVQFTKRDWRSRNRIVGPNGPQWLTIPVATKGRYTQTIAQAQVSDPKWVQTHLKAISHSWARAPYFKTYFPQIQAAYQSLGQETSLSRINIRLTETIVKIIGIDTPLHTSTDLPTAEGASLRLLTICKALAATTYISGPAAKDYLDVELFGDQGVAVDWMTYSEYPAYTQADGAYEPAVSVLDALMWLGADALFASSP